MFQIRNGDRKSNPLAEDRLHVRDAHDFAPRVEQRSAAVARIDLRSRLDIDEPLKTAVAGTDNPPRNRPLQSQRISNREDFISLFLVVIVTEVDGLEFEIGLFGNLQQGEVEERIERDNLDVVDPPADELSPAPRWKSVTATRVSLSIT